MLRITPALSIPEAEIELEFVRASGPGGQNVNKVATAVKLRFDVRHSPSLPDEVRARLMRLAGKRLSSEGVLIIDARRYRSQERNREDALARLVALIGQAAVKPKPRLRTKPSRAAKERRLADKQARGRNKSLRRPISAAEE